MSPLAVVDASVSLKWIFDDEQNVDAALALRDAWIAGRLALVAPSLWFYEVLNGLVIAVQTGCATARDSLEGWAHLVALGLPLADPPGEGVYRRALASGLTAYDAAYVALAEELQAPLWSGDRRLCTAGTRAGLGVRWIGDWSGP